ncbi:MAG: hypothetical protein JOZ69_04440 [Myxococcales bacterium]|nr:hypothetical protein [Myxococcales bacterium]
MTEDSDAGGEGKTGEDDHRPQRRHRRGQRALPQDCLGPDCPQFKGIFVRNVGTLARALPPSPATSRYASFLARNAESLWARDRLDDRGRVFFGPYWQGPFGFPNATVQTSALDALVEAMSVDDLGAARGR